MPTYCYACPTCETPKEVIRSMQDSDEPEMCECGERMERDYIAEHSSVRGDYNTPIVSTSMAFNTQDLAEHRRRHPGVDLKVDMAGHTAYPVLRSLSEKREYMKKRGWNDFNSFM